MSNQSNPYIPDETSLQLFQDEGWLQGGIIGSAAYGVALCLFVQCAHALIKRMSRREYRRYLPFFIFVCVVFILSTLYEVSLDLFTQLAYARDRNFPGGPGNYEAVEFWIPIDELGNVSFIIANWLMDLLLIWRCTVIYKTCGVYRWVVTVVLGLLFTSSFVVGVLYLVHTMDWTLEFICLTLALNVLGTFFIAARLILYRYRLVGLLGTGHGSHYIQIVAILIESASLYSAFIILLLVPYVLNNPLLEVFVQVLPQAQVVSSLLIILRVVEGRGWTEKTGEQMMTNAQSGSVALDQLSPIRFNSSNGDGSTTRVVDGASGVMLDHEVFVSKV